MPTDKDVNPPLYQMQIFAPDKVQAQSRFWYFIRFLKNVKKANGEIMACDQVRHTSSIFTSTIIIIMINNNN